MVDVVTQILIDRPASEVAGFAMDPDNAPKWYANIRSVEWVTSPPLALGSRIAFVAHFLGRRMAYTYEVTRFEPTALLVMRTAEGPFPMETSYTFEPTGENQTRMTLRNLGEPAGFSRWVSPFLSMAMRRANRQDLAAVKALLEDP